MAERQIMNSMKKWWKGRQPRERLLLVGVVALIFGLLLQLSWQQAEEYRWRSQQQFTQELQAMRSLPMWESALQSRGLVQTHYNEPPSVEALNTLAQQQGLALQVIVHQPGWQLQQATTLSFPALLQWLNEIKNRWGIEASQMQMQRDKQHVRLTQLELTYVQ